MKKGPIKGQRACNPKKRTGVAEEKAWNGWGKT